MLEAITFCVYVQRGEKRPILGVVRAEGLCMVRKPCPEREKAEAHVFS